MATAGVGNDGQQWIAQIGIEYAAGGQIGIALAAQRALRIVAFSGVIGVVKQGINGLVAFEVKQAQGLPFLYLKQPGFPCRDHMAIDGIFGTTVTGDQGHRSLLTGQKVGC